MEVELEHTTAFHCFGEDLFQRLGRARPVTGTVIGYFHAFDVLGGGKRAGPNSIVHIDGHILEPAQRTGGHHSCVVDDDFWNGQCHEKREPGFLIFQRRRADIALLC